MLSMASSLLLFLIELSYGFYWKVFKFIYADVWMIPAWVSITYILSDFSGPWTHLNQSLDVHKSDSWPYLRWALYHLHKPSLCIWTQHLTLWMNQDLPILNIISSSSHLPTLSKQNWKFKCFYHLIFFSDCFTLWQRIWLSYVNIQ